MIVPQWRGGEPSGQNIKVASKLSGWSLPTRPGPGPIWPPCGDERRADTDFTPRFLTAAGNHDLLAALRHDRIDAPWFIEGPIDGVSFATYVEKVLLPVLRPGDIVILDNLGSHRSKAVRQLIRSVGAKLFFLPKYSPDLTRLNRSLPSSSTSSAKLPREPSTQSAPLSATHPMPSLLRNVPTT